MLRKPSRSLRKPPVRNGTAFGLLTQRVLAGGIATILASQTCVAPALADPVTLTTRDGTYSIVGDLVEITDDAFTIRSSVGSMTVARDTVTCDGAGCPAGTAPAPQTTIAGDRALGVDLIPTLLSRFAASTRAKATVLKTIDNGLLVEVSGGDLPQTAAIKIVPSTSSDGIAALLDGTAELALSDRRALTREVRAAQNLGLGDLRSEAQEQIVALDGLLFITHPRNPVRSLTTADAAAIYAGKITNWSQVGGSDLPITLYASTPDLGSADVLDALVMRPAELAVSADATVLGSDRVVAETVATDPAAIGYTRIGNEGPARPLAIRGSCNIQTQPTPFTVKTEEYPLTRQLYIYRGKTPLSPIGDAFSRFLASDAAQTDVASAGFIDQSIAAATIDQQGMRIASAMMVETDPAQQQELRGMMDMLLAAERLSATFRYETGTDLLNARALADLDRLAALLSTDAYRGKEVLFLGFTDTVGDAALNRDLSLKRAEQIIATLLAEYPEVADNVRLTAVGLGEISSLACNDTDPGRAINRRVETWVRDFAQ